jgi:hypothetical protein
MYQMVHPPWDPLLVSSSLYSYLVVIHYSSVQRMKAFNLYYAVYFLVALSPLAESFVSPPRRAIVNHNVNWQIVSKQTSRITGQAKATTVLSKTVVDTILQKSDNLVLAKLIRIANHSTALGTLFFFGLVSMTSMMGGPGPIMPTLTSVLTKGLGSTTNAQFSSFFPTLITPPSYIFLIWPLIAVVQFITVTCSALVPSSVPLLSGEDLSALSVANLAATAWLFVSSKATSVRPPLASLLVLPMVPMFAGYPLRARRGDAKQPSFQNLAFQLFSSFTTIASFLALTVELQHGGRVPFFKGKAELSAMVFLSLYYGVIRLGGHGAVKRTVHAAAITAILSKRMTDACVVGQTPAGIARQFVSASFVGTMIVAFTALTTLVNKKTPKSL